MTLTGRSVAAMAVTSDLRFTVGDRVAHVDQSPPRDGRLLPMRGTVVGVQVRYLVQWDDGPDYSPLAGGGKQAFEYQGDTLQATPDEPEEGR